MYETIKSVTKSEMSVLIAASINKQVRLIEIQWEMETAADEPTRLGQRQREM